MLFVDTLRSKMCGANSGETPGPWSETSTTTDGPDRRASIRTSPRPCTREFSIRVDRIWARATGVVMRRNPRSPLTRTVR